MELKTYLFFILIFSSILTHAQDKSTTFANDTVVAKIGKDYLITANELRQYVEKWHFEGRFPTKSEAYDNALNEMIRYQIRLFDFFDRKLNENHALMDKISRIVNYELVNAFFNKRFVDMYANEKTALEAYKEMDKEVQCIDITLLMPSDTTKVKLDSLKAIALKIETGFSKNSDIKNILRHYPLVKFRLNAKRRVTWEETMADPVANVIFKLQKGFTRVVESADGFHIVKVLNIKKINLEPFEKIKDKIIIQLQKGYYQVFNNAFDNYRLGLIDKSSIKWNQSALNQIEKWSSEDARFYAGAYKDTIESAISHGNNFQILSYKNGYVDLKEYLRLWEQVIVPSPNTILNSSNIKEFILDALYNNDVVKAAKKIGLEKQLVNPYTKDPIIANRLVYLYNLAVIDASIPEATPEALQKFYEDHKDSIFYQLKVVYIYARIYSDSAKAAADINEIKNGTPFEKVKDAWLVKEYIRERDGSLKAYKTEGGDYLAKAAFKLSLDESAGPIEYNDSTKGKQFAVIKCFKIIPEKQLTYDDVKGKRVLEEFRDFYRKKIAEEIDAKLKKKYGVEIFPNALSEAISTN